MAQLTKGRSGGKRRFIEAVVPSAATYQSHDCTPHKAVMQRRPQQLRGFRYKHMPGRNGPLGHQSELGSDIATLVERWADRRARPPCYQARQIFAKEDLG